MICSKWRFLVLSVAAIGISLEAMEKKLSSSSSSSSLTSSTNSVDSSSSISVPSHTVALSTLQSIKSESPLISKNKNGAFAPSAFVRPVIKSSDIEQLVNDTAYAFIKNCVFWGKFEGIKQHIKSFDIFKRVRPAIVITPDELDKSVKYENYKGEKSPYRLDGKCLEVDNAECPLNELSLISNISAKLLNKTVAVTTLFMDEHNSSVKSEIKNVISFTEDEFPTAVQADVNTRHIYVGLNSGKIRTYYLGKTGPEERLSAAYHMGSVTDLRFLQKYSLLVSKSMGKNNRPQVVISRVTPTGLQPYLYLNETAYHTDYALPGGILRSHYGQEPNTWRIMSFSGGDTALYSFPQNYLEGNELAKPALLYAFLLQSLMLKTEGNTETYELIKGLSGSPCRATIEAPVMRAFDDCLREQATRLGYVYTPHDFLVQGPLSEKDLKPVEKQEKQEKAEKKEEK